MRIKQENSKQNCIFSIDLCKGTNFHICGPFSINLSVQKKKRISLVRRNPLLLCSGSVNFITFDIQRKSCLGGNFFFSILPLFAETVLVPAWVNPEMNL